MGGPPKLCVGLSVWEGHKKLRVFGWLGGSPIFVYMGGCESHPILCMGVGGWRATNSCG